MPADAGAVKVPLKAPVPPDVCAVVALVQGPLGEVLYCSVTVAPLGTVMLAVTVPENGRPACPVPTGVCMLVRVVVVG